MLKDYEYLRDSRPFQIRALVRLVARPGDPDEMIWKGSKVLPFRS